MKPNQKKEEQLGSYLTDIKELPPLSTSELPKKSSGITADLLKKEEDKNVNIKSKNLSQKKVAKLSDVGNISDLDEPNYNDKVFSARDILLGIANFTLLVVLIIILSRLPQVAQEFKAERIKEIQNQLDPDLEYADISVDLEKADKLNSLFLDEAGIVNFVGDVERLKTENPSIQKVTFASSKSIKDAMGYYGVPVIVEIVGNWQAIAKSLESIQDLPYLYKPVNIEVVPQKDNPQAFVFNYGGFLYVDEKEMSQ